MKSVRRLTMVAGLIVVTPAIAADMPVPPLVPQPTRASFPSVAPPAPAPVTIVPSVPDVAKDAPMAPPPAYRDPAQPEPDTAPTWLERFGPFLKSQLDMIFTGSIAPPEEQRCEPDRRHPQRSTDRCERPKPRGGRSTRRPPTLLVPATEPADVPRQQRSERTRQRGSLANAASPAPASVTVIAPLPRMQPLY